ncbi:hypothetical protein CR513_51735, partial [Mucuna pruriens]
GTNKLNYPHTPHQNGMVERKHEHEIELVLTLLSMPYTNLNKLLDNGLTSYNTFFSNLELGLASVILLSLFVTLTSILSISWFMHTT